MKLFPLFLNSPNVAWLLLILRAVELLLLCYYMKDTPRKVSTPAAFCTLAAAYVFYCVIYEVRSYASSLYSILIIHMLHLLIWGAAIYVLYRPDPGKLLTIDLLFFLFTRSSRWIFASIRHIALGGSISALHYLTTSYLYTWIPNLLLELLLIGIAKRRLPCRELTGDTKSNISLFLLAVLFLYVRYNVDMQITVISTLFELSILTLVYLFIILMAYIIPALAISQNKRREQEHILLLSEAKYQAALNRMEAEGSVKRMYHDIHRHLSCISAIAGDNEKVLDYISSIQTELTRSVPLINTGNEFLDSILTERIQQANQNHIQILCDIDMRRAAFLSPPDLCAIFCNAVDNAYEAVLPVQDPNKRLIRVKARSVENFLAVRISNYYEQPPEFQDGRLITTKSDKQLHGIGLQSIEHAVKKYGGTMDIQLQQPQIFVLKLLIPCPYEE